MDAATTLQIYQPLIVGLGAVALGTLGNTLLEWFRRSLHDRREAQTIRTAFSEELRVHRNMYSQALTGEQREETNGSLLIPIDRFMPVYDNLIGKVGLLRPKEAAAVLRAYSHMILVPKGLFVLGKVHRDEYASYLEVAVKYSDVVNNMNNAIVGVIDEALKALGCVEKL
jgi:hypothetical protein